MQKAGFLMTQLKSNLQAKCKEDMKWPYCRYLHANFNIKKIKAFSAEVGLIQNSFNFDGLKEHELLTSQHEFALTDCQNIVSKD